METYDQSEREQIEAIKRWWKDNGASVVVGIILGLGIIFGWRGWQSYLQQQSDMASNTYERMLLAFEQNYDQQGRQEASMLMSEYNKTTYASLAALYLAKQEFEAGNVEASHVNLKWMIEQNVMPELTQVARLRQTRLYLAENKLTEAKNALAGVQSEQFNTSRFELRGDIAVLENDLDGARKAYQTALESETLSSGQRTLLQMKLDDLGTKAPEFALTQKPKSALGSPTTLQDSRVVVDQPVVTEMTQNIQSVTPTEPVDILATPATQENNESPVTATDIDTQSALEIKSIAPLSPILIYDTHTAMNAISDPAMQLATVSNLIPQTSIMMTPRELQDNPVDFPVNTLNISTQVKQIKPIDKLQLVITKNIPFVVTPTAIQDNMLIMPLYSEQI